MVKKILLSPPDVGEAELNQVISAFKSGWIAPLGPEVDCFEQELADYVGVKHALCLSSGTAAIHLALILCGVKPGDSVFCSSFTFAASAFPIKYLGAEPVFIDSEADTWNICPELLEQALKKYSALGKLPRAVIAVDLYGMPCKWQEILQTCKRFGVPLIEDAAEGLGSSYRQRKLGSFGDLSVISFNGNKIITTSGGGALLSENSDYIKKARYLATQAREPLAHYEHLEVGYNYRMSNLLAALGRAQLSGLDEKVKRRRGNFSLYRTYLSKIGGINFLQEPEGFFSNRWLTTITFEKDAFSAQVVKKLGRVLEKEQIESRPLWKPMHLQPVFKDCEMISNGVSKELFESGLCLPSGSSLGGADIERVCGVIANGLKGA